MPSHRPSSAVLLVIAVALLVTSWGSGLSVAAQSADEPECPKGLLCRFVPAAYAQTNPADPNAYGNYDRAERPDDGDDIQYIVIHDTEESYDSAIAKFQDPHHGASAHYVIRSSDGQITQLVHTKDIAFHAGNYWFNMHSIGIEHEGVMADGARWYTEAMYRASARLVRYLAARYHIPLDREHIVGHEELDSVAQDMVCWLLPGLGALPSPSTALRSQKLAPIHRRSRSRPSCRCPTPSPPGRFTSVCSQAGRITTTRGSTAPTCRTTTPSWWVTDA